jgi:hypothetical protein
LAIATKRLKFTCFGDAAFSGKRYRFLITNRKPQLSVRVASGTRLPVQFIGVIQYVIKLQFQLKYLLSV